MNEIMNEYKWGAASHMFLHKEMIMQRRVSLKSNSLYFRDTRWAFINIISTILCMFCLM